MRKRLKRWIRTLVARLPRTPGARRHGLVGPEKLWKQKRAFQIEFLKSQGLSANRTLLDIGCGTLRGGIPIIEYLDRGHYTGFDVRPEVIEEARRELANHHLESKAPLLVTVPGFGELGHLGSFDVLWGFSVLMHLDDEILDECLAFANKHLEPDGRFFANVNVGEHSTRSWREFPLVRRPMSFYESRAQAQGLRMRDLGDLRSLGHDFGDVGEAHRMLLLERLDNLRG